jgi:predicted RNA-binding protein with PUA-like domain
VRKFKRTITLHELKEQKKLADMPLLRKGNRLSVMPVDAKHWKHILSME